MSLKPYEKMSHYYDIIYLKDFKYEQHCDLIETILIEHHKDSTIKKILDAGCGTGNHSMRFVKKRYDVTGIDSSDKMIEIAKKKNLNVQNPNLEFINMDMREIRLSSMYDVIISVGGSFCYLLSDQDVQKFLISAKQVLNDQGIILFEFWQTPSDSTKTFTSGTHSCTMNDKHELIVKINSQNFEKEKMLLTKTYKFIITDTDNVRIIDHFTENHIFRVYDRITLEKILNASGLRSLGFYVDSQESPPKIANDSDFRVLCVAGPLS